MAKFTKKLGKCAKGEVFCVGCGKCYKASELKKIGEKIIESGRTEKKYRTVQYRCPKGHKISVIRGRI